MTKLTNTERLLLIEKDVSDLKEDVHVLKDLTDKNHDLLLKLPQKLDDRYPTRREFNAIKWVLGISVSILAVYEVLVRLINASSH